MVKIFASEVVNFFIDVYSGILHFMPAVEKKLNLNYHLPTERLTVYGQPLISCIKITAQP